MFGNSTFGHYLHMGSQGQGFGKDGFGARREHNAFGSSKKGDSGSFGQTSGSLDPNGLMFHAYDGQHYGHAGILRQNSLLGEMTQSKQERAKGVRPWAFSSFSYPQGEYGDGVFASIYEKPLEKPKPKLERQPSMVGPEGLEPVKRAPSFKSDPERMRAKTISGAALPPRRTPRVTRSLSIVDDITTPQNMDIAVPALRRQQSHDLEKARKKSMHKRHSFTLPKFGKHRRSSKGKDSVSEVNTESIPSSPPRSRADTGFSQTSAPALMQDPLTQKQTSGSQSSPTTSNQKSLTNGDETAHAALILSLMNTEIPDEVFEPNKPPSQEGRPRQETVPSDSAEETTQSPTGSPRQTELERPEQNTVRTQISAHTVYPARSPIYEQPKNSPVEHSPTSPASQDRRPDELSKVTTQYPLQNIRTLSVSSDRSSASPQPQDAQPYLKDRSPIHSPLMITRRFQNPKTDAENESIKSDSSEHLTPSRPTSGKQKSRSPTRNPILLSLIPAVKAADDKPTGRPVSNTSTNDSDTSDIYYDANQSQHSSPILAKSEASPVRKRVVKKNRNACSSSTLTDGEDTTSSDTPPKATYCNSFPAYKSLYNDKPDYEIYPTGTDTDPHEAETLKIRHRDRAQRKTGRSYIENIPDNIIVNTAVDADSTLHHPVYIGRSYAPVFKTQLDIKDNSNEHLTADSSESGYGTSHLPKSPKNYDPYKVSQFVNSLPNYPDIDEQRSDSSRESAVRNGSETDSDLEGIKAQQTMYANDDADLNGVNCHSGSESEDESIKTNESTSKLEVMKLLESPTDVRTRITNNLKEKSKDKGHARFEEDDSEPIVKMRKDSNTSETEVLKLLKKEKVDKDKDSISETSPDEKHIEAKQTVVSQEPNAAAETKLLHPSEADRQTSWAAALIERVSFRREYSSAYQTKTTNCIDALLHFLNLILFLSSAAVIGTGLWLHLKDLNINDITMILGNNLLQVITYVAIAGAGVALLAAFCLCCGIRQDKTGLGFYAFVLVAVVIAFATAAVLCTIFSDKLHGIEFRVKFKDRLVTMYGVDTHNNVENMVLTSAWDDMQSIFECCGGDGNENDTESWSIYRNSQWFLQHANKGMIFVPQSCCKKNSNIKVCQGGDHNLLGPPRYAPPRNKYYPDRNPNLNMRGCYSFFSSYLSTLTTYIAITCASLAGLYFITVMLTWVFCFKKSQDLNEDNSLEEFYDIEDDVFNSEATNDKDNDITETEETKLLTSSQQLMKPAPKPVLKLNINKQACDSMNLKEKEDQLTGRSEDDSEKYKNRISENLNKRGDFSGSSEESNTDSDTDSYSNSDSGNTTPTEERRNMWLESGYAARHILSIAIEEEDSNFEDSDADNKNMNASVHTQLPHDES